MTSQPSNHRMLQPDETGHNKLRVSDRAAHGKTSERKLIKCGCCDERVEIYYDDDELEINGVIGSIPEWRRVLLPLLKQEHRVSP